MFCSKIHAPSTRKEFVSSCTVKRAYVTPPPYIPQLRRLYLTSVLPVFIYLHKYFGQRSSSPCRVFLMDAVVPSAGNILDFACFSNMQGYNRKLEEVDMTVWRGEIDTDQLGRGFAWPCCGKSERCR